MDKGDIRRQGQSNTCRICSNERTRAVYHGRQVAPYRLGDTFRCGHPRTRENSTHGNCKQCHNAKVTQSRHAHESYIARRQAIRERNAVIVADWINGKSMTAIAKQHKTTAERIRQIVRDGGGVTVRMRRDDLALLGDRPYAITTNQERAELELVAGVGK